MEIYAQKTFMLISLKLSFIRLYYSLLTFITDWKTLSITEQYLLCERSQSHRFYSSILVQPCPTLGLNYIFKSCFLKIRLPETRDAKNGTRAFFSTQIFQSSYLKSTYCCNSNAYLHILYIFRYLGLNPHSVLLLISSCCTALLAGSSRGSSSNSSLPQFQRNNIINHNIYALLQITLHFITSLSVSVIKVNAIYKAVSNYFY